MINIFQNLINLRGTPLAMSLMGILILIEIIYFIIIRTEKKEYKDSLWTHVIAIKFGSICLTGLGLGLIWILLIFIVPLLWIFGIAGLIAGYILLNYWMTKKFGKFETKKEFEERMLEKSKFRIGDKVKIKPKLVTKPTKEYDSDGDLVNVYPKFKSNNPERNIHWGQGMDKYKNKILTISDYDKDADLKIKEDEGIYIWCDLMFDKVRGKKSRRR